ncbi:hypothetical protein Nepgr_010006 [Nepenthes gracilis]|uniref:Uncharacterized protein n=1 Tax=Nepenthes gracilis TaxID=150966 RepID=A0AAD3SCA7_NEPGR|nr:hypothetical protein Nepgr_010006 [Nepenthes gracilis]
MHPWLGLFHLLKLQQLRKFVELPCYLPLNGSNDTYKRVINFCMAPICSSLARPRQPAEAGPAISAQLSETTLRLTCFSS